MDGVGSHRRFGWRFCTLIVALLVASACGDSSSDSADTSGDRSAVLPIQVDGSNEAREITLYNYFPDEVVARPGDTLHFTVTTVGEPQTVTFGTLVDSALAATEASGLRSPEDVFFKEPPEMTALPSVFASTPTYTPENQSTGQPCYLDEGTPPVADPCPQREQPAFNGTQAYYNSGLLENGSTYDVKLSETIQPGTYRYMNVIYRGLMNGSVTVVEKDAERPGPAEVERNGQAELRQALESAAGDVSAVAKQATPDKALAGVITSSPHAVGMVFEPEELTIPVGGSVTWSVYLCHTITFNAPPNAYGDLKKTPDGSVRLNPIPYTPAQAPEPPFGSGNAEATWSGTGLFNSGGLCALAPNALTYKLTFSNPGTYQLTCLFHPAMTGRITVG